VISVGVTPITGAPTSRLTPAVAVSTVAAPAVHTIDEGSGCGSTVLNEYWLTSEASAFCRPIVALIPWSNDDGVPNAVFWYWKEI
jgi:hypothetical protein